MNERTTLEKIAGTVDDAVAEGLAELGVTADAVEVEVLDAGSRGLLGIGGRQARVRLTIRVQQDVQQTTPAKEQDEANVDENDQTINLARQTVSDLLEKMGIHATKVDGHHADPDERGGDRILIDVYGDDLGVLIGRRAEILNAMQYLVNLIVSKQAEHWVQVTIDVEGYRQRRERQLQQMAKRMADQAIKTGHRQSLEPMPANERRIVHLTLREHPGVITQSVGEEPGRKVTISPK